MELQGKKEGNKKERNERRKKKEGKIEVKKNGGK